jgi:hypothetical protein
LFAGQSEIQGHVSPQDEVRLSLKPNALYARRAKSDR